MLPMGAWGRHLSKTSSSLVGRSGRVYVRDRVLQAHPQDPDHNIYLAHCEGRLYVLKSASRSIFEFSQELRREFGTNSRLRTHIDDNESEHVLVYEYFQDNLLSFVKRNSDLPIEKRKSILHEVGLGLNDMHTRNWVHLGNIKRVQETFYQLMKFLLDLKPNNVLLDWNRDEDAQFNVERVALADLDCALKLEGDKLLHHRIGNVMWRSPEGQTGRGIGKPSEVFSFGLLVSKITHDKAFLIANQCLFTITGAETLHPDFELLQEEGTEPEDVILYKLLSMFGPVPSEFIAHINDQYYGQFVTALSEEVAGEDPSVRFPQWSENDFPNLNPASKDMIMKMTNLDPSRRATMAQILDDSWWK